MSSSSFLCQQGPCLLLSLLVIGVMYHYFQRKQIKECFLPQQTVKVVATDKDGYANPLSNQQQLFVQPDPFSKPKGPQQLLQLTPQFAPTRVEKDSNTKKKSKESFTFLQNGGPQPQNLQERGAQLPLYRKEQDLEFLQIPGTYQSNPPPRFVPEGLASQVRYNLPETKYQSCDPNNPLPYASMVECPKLKESFQYAAASPSAKAIDELSTLTDVKSHLKVTNTLATVPMTSQTATMFGSTGGDEGEGTDDAQPTISYDRIIIANLPRQRGDSDYIRGDLPIVPQKPVLDSSSFVMFRPSNGPEVLNTGAMAVLGGAFNSNVRDVVQLQMQDQGGVLNTGGGAQWSPSPATAYGQQAIPTEQRQQLMANITQANEGGSSGLLGDVSFQKAYQSSPESMGMSAQRLPF